MLKSFVTSRILPGILLLIIGVTPLIEAQNKFGYEYVKVLFFIYAVLFMVILIEIFFPHLRSKIFTRTKLSIYSVLFLLSILVSSIFHPQIFSSLFGLYPYYQGIILYLFMVIFYLLVSVFPINFKSYIYTAVASSFLVSFVSLWQWVAIHIFHMPLLTYSGRVISTFGQPNLYSGYLIIVLPLYFILLEKIRGKERVLLSIAVGILVLAIIASMSRLAWVLLVVMGITVIFFYLRKSLFFKKLVIAIVVISILLAGLTLPKIIQTELNTSVPEKRIYIWQTAYLQGIKQPIFGYGMDSFRDVYASYFPKAKQEGLLISRKDLVVDRSHNYLLDLFIYAGIVGVVLWVLIVRTVFLQLKHQRWLALSLWFYIIFVMVHPQSIIHLIYFWFLAGLASKPSNYFE